MTKKAITVTVKIGENEFSKAGMVDIYTVDDILNLMQSEPDKVTKVFNAAVEQSERASIRNEVVQENGAPERALLKTAKQIFEARQTLAKSNPKTKAVTMEEATRMAKTMLGIESSTPVTA